MAKIIFSGPDQDSGDILQRNDIYCVDDSFYPILSVYSESYNKWRIVKEGKKDSTTIFHLVKGLSTYRSLKCYKDSLYLNLGGDGLAKGELLLGRELLIVMPTNVYQIQK